MQNKSALTLFILHSSLFIVFLHAQADYRNLDPGRPAAIEDAQPIEFRAMEFQLGVPRFQRERGGGWQLAFEPEWKWGLARDLQFGIATEDVLQSRGGRKVHSLADTQFHLLYNLNQETRTWPALSFRPEVALPTGGLGSEHAHAGLKLLLTRTIGRNRVHLNGIYTVGPTERPGRGGELLSRFLYGAAYERTFPLKFFLIVADAYARKPIDGAPVEVVFDLGTRVQLTPTLVMDAGLNTGAARRAGHTIGFTVGLNYVFSFRSLFPR